MKTPDSSDVIAAADRIHGWIHATDLIRSETVDLQSGRRVYLKAEHLQKTGSYKARGAANHVLTLLAAPKPPVGVVAASSGNHGQAVAWAAKKGLLSATVVVPTSISAAKLAAIEGYGARVVKTGPDSEERLAIAENLAQQDGLFNIPPYDHPVTIAGQGTCVLEALDQVPEDLQVVVVPVSGGGLAAGTVLAASTRSAELPVYGVEPQGADDTKRSIDAGRLISVEPSTIADALRARQPGALTFEINRRGLRGVICVTDAEIGAAMRMVWERVKQVVEPAGAAALAAVLARHVPGNGPALVVLSGGNVDLDVLAAPWWERINA